MRCADERRETDNLSLPVCRMLPCSTQQACLEIMTGVRSSGHFSADGVSVVYFSAANNGAVEFGEYSVYSICCVILV